MTEVGRANESSMRHPAGQNATQAKERHNDCFGFAWASQERTAIPQALARIAAGSSNHEDHDASRAWAKEVAMAKVIEIYIPKNFRKPMKWVPELERGRILEFRTQTRKLA